MAHLGNYLVGDSVPIVLATIDKVGVPTKPDATPTYHIIQYSGTTAVLGSRIPAVLDDRSSAGAFLGLFAARYRLTGTFSQQNGLYMIVKKWVIGGQTYHDCDTFTVNSVAGDDQGPDNGAVIGVCWTPRSNNVAIHFDTEDGDVQLGINPR